MSTDQDSDQSDQSEHSSDHSSNQQSPKGARKKGRFVDPIEADSMPMPNLPHDIVIEILTRLPVKSLLRFRSVSKSWLSTITDPQFVKNHLYLQTENDDVSKWRIIMRYPFYNLKSCSLFSIFHEPYGFAIELNYPSKELQGTVRIVGSCNGLICISIEADTGFSIFIWNPSTRESKRLPDTSLDKSLYHYVVLGFGYDCSIDDYKVVRLSCPPSLPVVTVYSLKTDCWRQIENFPHYVVPNQSGKFVNGTLNWVGVCGARTDRSWFIVSLDLAQETYKMVPQPNYGRFKPVLRVLGGCLCIICDKGGSSVDVWIMKEYGVGESWTKLVSIPHLTERSPNTLHCSGTLWYLKDGGILVDFSGVLVMFDLKESALKYPLIYGVHDCHEVDIYVESLVSPNANNGIAR